MAETGASVAKPRARSKSHKKRAPSDATPEPEPEPEAPRAPAAAPMPSPKRKTPDDAAPEPGEPPRKTRRADAIDLDAEPDVSEPAKMRFFTCHNHHTSFGSGYASTLVCAPDMQGAQRELDAWLVRNKLRPLAEFPYQLHEIDCTTRRVVMVSSNDAVRADVQPSAPHGPGQKRTQWTVFAYQDIPFEGADGPAKYGNAGAVLVAEDEYDAATILTTVLWDKKLLVRSVAVAPDSMERVSEGRCVVPLSLYMCAE